MNSHDPINPAHYRGTRVMEIIEEFDLNFSLGNAIKYLLRAGSKPNTPASIDLKKAIWYIQRHVDRLNEMQEEIKSAFGSLVCPYDNHGIHRYDQMGQCVMCGHDYQSDTQLSRSAP